MFCPSRALTTCHVLSSHMWLVAAVLVLVENYHSRRFYRKAPGLAVRSGALPFPARTERGLSGGRAVCFETRAWAGSGTCTHTAGSRWQGPLPKEMHCSNVAVAVATM